jgi:hypothetical protein
MKSRTSIASCQLPGVNPRQGADDTAPAAVDALVLSDVIVVSIVYFRG